LEYFLIIREVCKRYGLLFAVDDVMMGLERTGRKFGIDHWSVIPDLIITSKDVSSGYTPLGTKFEHSGGIFQRGDLCLDRACAVFKEKGAPSKGLGGSWKPVEPDR
jgi:hypothetical protein